MFGFKGLHKTSIYRRGHTSYTNSSTLKEIDLQLLHTVKYNTPPRRLRGWENENSVKNDAKMRENMYFDVFSHNFRFSSFEKLF